MPQKNDKKTSTPFTNHPCFFFGGVFMLELFSFLKDIIPKHGKPRIPGDLATKEPNIGTTHLQGSHISLDTATQGGATKHGENQRAGCKQSKVGHLGHLSWFLCKQAGHQIYPNLPLKQQITNHTFKSTSIHHPSPNHPNLDNFSL